MSKLKIKQNLEKYPLIAWVGLAGLVCFIIFCFFQVQNKNDKDKIKSVMEENVAPQPTKVLSFEEIAKKKGITYNAPEPTEIPALE